MNNMEVYKILHKPTGLFFTPSRGHGNLSTQGKIYSRKPSLEWAGGSVRLVITTWSSKKLTKKQQILVDYFEIEPNDKGYYYIDAYFKISKEDWEIIEM